jgi:hypothetical protein
VNKNLRRTAIFAVALMMLATVALGRKFALVMSPAVPAAKGDVETGTDKNGNTEVTIKVENLAMPTSLRHPAQTYVVWIQAPGQQPQNVGKLDVGGNLKGEFKTVTPLKNFEIFGTAESNALVQSPTGERIFHATVQQ